MQSSLQSCKKLHSVGRYQRYQSQLLCASFHLPSVHLTMSSTQNTVIALHSIYVEVLVEFRCQNTLCCQSTFTRIVGLSFIP